MSRIDQQNKSHQASQNPEWWRGAVIYQIYPRSFQDTNDDGIGDLAGITQRLEYVAGLGVDAIWISPFVASPMQDFGYDVSDYCAVHPMFGGLDDFDTLLARAHELGLRVMIDLVLSHTSDQHPWFAESRQSKHNPKSDWYVWADAKADGMPPNNWLSIFGGVAWQWDSRREQYYLHNFLGSQPDLNFHCTQVQDALLEVARFWLERGVDGFRLDTINFYFHDALLRDNPPLSVNERSASIAPQVNPYNYQNHLYSKNRPENLKFLERFRLLLDEYGGRACLGEVGDAQRGIEIMGEYTAGNRRAHMCYGFEFLEATPATPDWIARTFSRFDAYAGDGWPCWAFSNHDVRRHRTRWNLHTRALRVYVVLLMAMRGSVCLYQGEELGFDEAVIPFDALQDPYGKEFWPNFAGRDGCRTPMVWDGTAVHGGFSSVTPWLPVGANHLRCSVLAQQRDDDSLLHHYQQTIALRQRLPVLRSGQQIDMRAENTRLSFLRTEGEQQVFCAFNLGEHAQTCQLPPGGWLIHAAVSNEVGETLSGEQSLPGWSYLLAERT